MDIDVLSRGVWSRIVTNPCLRNQEQNVANRTVGPQVCDKW